MASTANGARNGLGEGTFPRRAQTKVSLRDARRGGDGLSATRVEAVTISLRDARRGASPRRAPRDEHRRPPPDVPPDRGVDRARVHRDARDVAAAEVAAAHGPREEEHGELGLVVVRAAVEEALGVRVVVRDAREADDAGAGAWAEINR